MNSFLLRLLGTLAVLWLTYQSIDTYIGFERMFKSTWNYALKLVLNRFG